jgi:PAS domain S-box-containing protein
LPCTQTKIFWEYEKAGMADSASDSRSNLSKENKQLRERVRKLEQKISQIKSSPDSNAFFSEKQRLFMDRLPIGLIIFNHQGEVVEINQLGQVYYEACHPENSSSQDTLFLDEDENPIDREDLPCVRACRDKCALENVIVGIRKPGDSLRWLTMNATVSEKYITIVFMNGTEQKNSQIQITRSNKRFSDLFQGMLNGFSLHEIICNEEGQPIDYRFLDVNPAFEKLTGLKRADIIGKRVLEILPQTESYWIERFGRVALSGTPDEFEEYSVEFDKYFHVNTYQPQPGQFACLFTDITEQRVVEKALQITTQKYKTLFEMFPLGITISDEEGNILEANRESERILGLSMTTHAEREIDGKEWKGVRRDGSSMPQSEFTSVRALRENRPIENEIMGLERDNGKVVWLNVSAAPIPLEGYGVAIVYGDVTRQVEMEESIRQTSRMEATSTLAGGIAHDFNNLMVGVLGNAELLKSDLKEMEELAEAPEMLDEIIHAAQRAGDLAQQLLAYARGGKYHSSKINLNRTIQDVLRLQEASLPQDISIEKRFDPLLWEILADESQIKQVILNLCINAVEAIPDSGKIIITTSNHEILEKDTLSTNDLPVGQYVQMEIQDTGCGIEDSVIKKIFEPFFSTKFQGRGLGLAAVYGIVTNHGGDVFVESRPGEGAKFTLLLPAAREKTRSKKSTSQAQHPSREKTILLVEDDPSTLSPTRRILERLGYHVIVATDGLEAIDQAKHFDGPIHMTLLDLELPKMSGSECFPTLSRERPGMPILLFSGYELDKITRQLLEQGAKGFIQKPFRLDTLADRINRILENSSS